MARKRFHVSPKSVKVLSVTLWRQSNLDSAPQNRICSIKKYALFEVFSSRYSENVFKWISANVMSCLLGEYNIEKISLKAAITHDSIGDVNFEISFCENLVILIDHLKKVGFSMIIIIKIKPTDSDRNKRRCSFPFQTF